MVGQVISTSSTDSAIMKTPKANEVIKSLLVLNREYAVTAKMVRKTAREIPPT